MSRRGCRCCRRSSVMSIRSDTYWYFQGAPELLALAAERLERSWERHP